MTTSILTRPTFVEGIQVSGLTNFEGNRWREAILHYLFGVWGNNREVTYRPKINFGDVTLRLMGDQYIAYGTSASPVTPIPTDLWSAVKDPTQNNVEAALIRFVKNNKIKRLVIHFQKGSVFLTKWRGRGELVVSTEDLPSYEDVMRDLGYDMPKQ